MKEIRSLSRKKHRDRLGETIVEGTRGVQAAVAAGAPVKEILMSESAARSRAGAIGAGRVPCYVVADSDMERISDVRTSQGVLAVVGVDLLDADRLLEARRVIALDGLQDPGNAGTLIRTAAWFGVDAVITATGTVDLYNPKVVRAAMGGLWDIGHVDVDELAPELARLRSRGFTIYGADLKGTSAAEWQPSEPSVLVLGSEAHGLSDPVESVLDDRIVVPGAARRRGAESLNVAVAAGILVYEWTNSAYGTPGTLEKTEE